MRDPYIVLGVTRDASQDEIKSAYRKLAMELHPDRNPGDAQAEERFKEVRSAYDELTKPKAEQPQGQPQGWPPGFDEHFARMFAQHFGQTFRPTNPDITVVAELTLKQVFEGCDLDVVIDALPNKPTYRVHIPRSIEPGQRVRVQGAGSQVNTSLPPGDLYIVPRINNHPYERMGQHLFMNVQIDALEAILGKTIGVQTIENKPIEVKVPPGTQFGDRLRVPQHGMFIPNMNARGDLFLNIIVQVPRTLTSEHGVLLERIREQLHRTETSA